MAKLVNLEHPQRPTIGLRCDKCGKEDRDGGHHTRHGQGWSRAHEEGVRREVEFYTTTVTKRSGLSAINRDDPENPKLFQAFGEWEWDFCPSCFDKLVKGINFASYSDIDEHGTPLSRLEDVAAMGRSDRPHSAVIEGIAMLRSAVFPQGHPAPAKIEALVDQLWGFMQGEVAREDDD